MSAQIVESSHENNKQDDFTLLQEFEGNSGNTIECLSVYVDDDQNETEVQSLILDEQLLDSGILTAITLADGTRAFVTNNPDPTVYECRRESSGELSSDSTVLTQDLSQVSDEETLHLELDPELYLQMENGNSENGNDTWNTRVEIVDGMAYLVSTRLDLDNHLWKIDDGNLKTETKIVINKPVENKSKQNKHYCPRDGCSKAYSTPHHLKVHERSHTGQRPYECSHPKCDKTFSTGYSLKAHLRTHTGEKPYKCPTDQCDKSFKTSGDLLKHLRTHTGERPFICPVEGCGRSFTTSNIRKVHVRTHTGERPYKCTYPKCGKAFASATNHKNHVRIHSGEKPYVCSIENCGRRFTEYSSLYKHHLVHTQQRPFECQICFRKYRQNSTLMMHKKTAHSLVESDDGVDIFLQNSTELLAQNKKITMSKNGHLRFSEDSTDNETQILLVGDPTQIAALQQINLEEFDDAPIDTSLEALNIKLEDIGFQWN